MFIEIQTSSFKKIETLIWEEKKVIRVLTPGCPNVIIKGTQERKENI